MAKAAFSIRGIEPLKQYIDALPRAIRGFVTQEIASTLVEDYLRPYPPYRYASRKSAYGSTGAKFKNGNPVPPGYFSAKQFFYVMSRIRSGDIHPGRPGRTGKLADAWKVTGDGVKAKISVDMKKAPYAGYVVGDIQAAQPYHAGWVKANYTIDYGMKAATEKAQKAVDRWLKETPKTRPA